MISHGSAKSLVSQTSNIKQRSSQAFLGGKRVCIEKRAVGPAAHLEEASSCLPRWLKPAHGFGPLGSAILLTRLARGVWMRLVWISRPPDET